MQLLNVFAHGILAPYRPHGRVQAAQRVDALSLYTFNTGTARHYFCKHCGCRPFYVPRSNPDGFSVNVRCLETTMIDSLKVTPFDGLDWEGNADNLAHLSKQKP